MSLIKLTGWHHDHARTALRDALRLKSQIPIRTWADWDDAVPGFAEIDELQTTAYQDATPQPSQ